MIDIAMISLFETAGAKAVGISFGSSASQQIPLQVERPPGIDHNGSVPASGISASLRKAETAAVAKAVVLRACQPLAGCPVMKFIVKLTLGLPSAMSSGRMELGSKASYGMT